MLTNVEVDVEESIGNTDVTFVVHKLDRIPS